MNPAISFRQASTGDVESIRNLINMAFEVERFFIDGDRITRKGVEDQLRSGTFLMAEEDGLALGCVWIELRGERAYLGLLSVDPSRQGAGLGRGLMRAAEDFARQKGCSFMDLRIVNVRAELPAFYRGLGYVETGAEAFAAAATPKVPCHFVKMSKPLAQASAQA